jgi:hypothetical protein
VGTYTGLVVKERFGAGSKSDHDAVMLRTPSRDYVLRRQGGNPFFDPELDKLVGKTISFDGSLYGYTLFISDWKENIVSDTIVVCEKKIGKR